MRYAGLNKNDFSAAPGVSVTFYTQGCPHHCPGCHNPETWNFEGGKEFTPEVIDEILEALTANNIMRSLAIQGGEPLCVENEFLTLLIVKAVKEKFPDIKIYIWTGYYFNSLPNTPYIKQILELTDCLIDGPYIQDERDITLPMRGSRNQNIIYFDNNKII